MLKDDNLGIGAKKGAQHDECTGLLGLQGLLGRLNGNTEQVAQVKNEEDRQKNDWIASKWGMKFVRGEIWVADDLTTLRAKVDKAKEDKEAALKAKEEAAVVKVKREEDEDSGQRKKRKRDDGEKQSSKKSSSKDKKSSKKESSGDETATTSTSKSSKSTSAVASEDESESQARRRKRSEEKEAKKERKEKRADKRTEKKERKDKRAEKRKQKKRKAGEDSDSSSESDVPSGRVTPASAMNGRHALRARFIAAKRSATMDATSLNEVCFIRRHDRIGANSAADSHGPRLDIDIELYLIIFEPFACFCCCE